MGSDEAEPYHGCEAYTGERPAPAPPRVLTRQERGRLVATAYAVPVVPWPWPDGGGEDAYEEVVP